MQTNNILSAELIDIIFDDRYKDYGAYELRKTYSKRIKKALLVTTTITALVIGGATLAGTFKKPSNPLVNMKGVNIIDIVDQPENKKIIPEPIKKIEKQPVQVKTEKLTTYVIKPNDEVETPPPSQGQLENAAIGLDKKDGVDFTGIEEPVDKGPGDGKGIVEQKIEKEMDLPISIVEIEAKFLGNWKAFLERNLNANVPLDNSAPFGRYSVVVQFVVDREGNVSDIKPLTKHGYGMEEEAVRVLRKAAKWEPAIQNGYKVKAYHKQVITYVVLEE